MKILIFGASGMVGAGVLREALRATDVTQVTTIGRSAVDIEMFRRDRRDPAFNFAVASKLRQRVHADLFDVAGYEAELGGHDACFFCLGVSSLGMREAVYRHISYSLTLGIAAALRRRNPQMRFIYVSGAGTDSSERGRTMWARVKGKTENDLLQLGFASAQMFRPGVIIAKHGVRSKTLAYRLAYPLLAPLLPLLQAIWPEQILTTELLGRAMLEVARHGDACAVMETGDILRAGLVSTQRKRLGEGQAWEPLNH